MNDISIAKANDRYSCNLCKKHSTLPNNLYEINISTISVCLCTDCFRKVRMQMNNVVLDGYKGWADKEDTICKDCSHYTDECNYGFTVSDKL